MQSNDSPQAGSGRPSPQTLHLGPAQRMHPLNASNCEDDCGHGSPQQCAARCCEGSFPRNSLPRTEPQDSVSWLPSLSYGLPILSPAILWLPWVL